MKDLYLQNSMLLVCKVRIAKGRQDVQGGIGWGTRCISGSATGVCGFDFLLVEKLNVGTAGNG